MGGKQLLLLVIAKSLPLREQADCSPRVYLKARPSSILGANDERSVEEAKFGCMMGSGTDDSADLDMGKGAGEYLSRPCFPPRGL